MATHKDQRQLRGPEDASRQLAASLRSASGKALAERLAARYPLAFIDEFQDTDPVQLNIFEALYPVGGPGTLVLIGDPKQAIYGFRGADLFAYLRARQALPDGDRLRMEQNWRSSPPVIEMLNRFYQRQPDPFLSEAMSFEPVTAAKTYPSQPWARNRLRRRPWGSTGTPPRAATKRKPTRPLPCCSACWRRRRSKGSPKAPAVRLAGEHP